MRVGIFDFFNARKTNQTHINHKFLNQYYQELKFIARNPIIKRGF
jgi:hypothetical protein